MLPLQNCFDYGRRPELAIAHGWIYYTWVAPVLAAMVLWIGRRRLPIVVAGLALAVVGLLPVLGLVPFHYQVYTTVADHYLYLPMAGVGLALAGALLKVPARAGRWIGVISCIVLIGYGIRAWAVADVWKDNRTLYGNVIKVNPSSWLALNNLGHDYFMQGCYLLDLSALQKENGESADAEKTHQRAMSELENAEKYFRETCRINPRFAQAKVNVATSMAQRGLLAPTGQLRGRRIQKRNLPRGVGGQDSVADAAERDPEPFLLPRQLLFRPLAGGNIDVHARHTGRAAALVVPGAAPVHHPAHCAIWQKDGGIAVFNTRSKHEFMCEHPFLFCVVLSKVYPIDLHPLQGWCH
jgi:hypothetical protein